MNKHDEMIRTTRRMAGLPVEDTSEEVMVVQPARDTDFAMNEVRDLAGINDIVETGPEFRVNWQEGGSKKTGIVPEKRLFPVIASLLKRVEFPVSIQIEKIR